MLITSTFIGLINNSALLLALVLIYDVLVLRRPGEKVTVGQIPLGAILGMIGIFIMLNPWEFLPGIIFDTRTVLLCISGLFFGTVPTAIAAAMLAGYRLYLGGPGVVVGLATILAAAAIGLLWRHLQRKELQQIRGGELYLLGFLTHLVMLACMFLLPLSVALDVLGKIGVPVLVVLPLATLLLGKLMINRLERLSAIEALRKSKNRYSTIFYDHSAIKLLIDPGSGRIIDANKAAEFFYGWSREQLCRLTVQEINTLSPEHIQEEMRRAATSERSYFEFQHRLADGSIRDVEVYSSAVVIDDTTYLHSIIHDVTVRKEAEEQLRETKAILQAAMDNSQAGIAIADAPSGKLRYVNRAGLFIRGEAETGQVDGVDLDSYVSSWKLCDLDGTPLKTEEVPLARAILYGETCSREFLIRRQGGDDHAVYANAAPITDGSGNVTAGIVVFLDITERKKIEQELARQKQLFETMFNSIPDGVIVTDTERKIVLANKGMLPTFGYSPDELIGRSTQLLYADQERFSRSGEEVFNKDAPQTHDLFITRYRKKNGKEFPGETFGAKLYDENGNWLGNLGVMRDITTRQQQEDERVLLQKQLMQAQKMEAIGTLAGGIAHDFNNILGVILGYAEMVHEASVPGSLVASDSEQIISAGNRARELVKQILAFSRQSSTEVTAIDPSVIVKEVLKLLRATLPSTISLEQRVEATAYIMADVTKIHQIIMNLCTNSFHAMEEEGGTLALHLDQVVIDRDEDWQQHHIAPGNYVHLAVIDDGPGIPEEIRSKIFEPYFTTKEIGRGTGMGLAIVHGIVSGYGGFINWQSEVGKGTAFHLYFPAVAQTAPANTTVQSPIEGREHILFVDDEQALADMSRAMLTRLGYSVTVRTSSIEALATFENRPDDFDLIITDQTMPAMTGFDLARRILQVRPDMPIILCTGFSGVISRERALAAGIKGFAEKPLVKSEIGSLIRRVLECGE